MNKFSSITILTVLLFLTTSAGAEALRSDRTHWKVGIENFSGTLSSRYEYLKNSIPDLIRRELDQTDTHILSFSEKERYRNDVIEKKRMALVEELKIAYAKQDLLLFKESGTAIRDSESEKNLNLIREELRDLDLIDPESVETASMLPLLWQIDKNGENLLEEKGFDPFVISKVNDLDFLISGSIKEIDEYFRLIVRGYDRSEDREMIIFSGTSSPDLLSGLAAQAAGELRSVMLGRAWAALNITADNPEALIYCNGTLIGVGEALVNTLEPGDVLLEAVGQDNSYWSEEVLLTSGSELVVNAILSESDSTALNLETDPSGADVYMGARWIGRTPLSIPRFNERSYWVTIRSQDYYDHSFEVSPESPDLISIPLIEEELSRLDFFDLKKKEFYRTLGWFSLSVALPVLSGGIAQNFLSSESAYAAEYKATDNPEYYDMANEAYNSYFISQGIFLGSIAVSGGLLADVFVKLARYIKAAEALAE
ncbi:MAG: PEGA domain-containing protein [Spirochaetales bacterium]|nr:PEGA domain-containing protein [Spirochaetales bacterium]